MRKLALRVTLAAAGLTMASFMAIGQQAPGGGPSCSTQTTWDACEDCLEDALTTALAACPKTSGSKGYCDNNSACAKAAWAAFETGLKSCPTPTKHSWCGW